MEPSPSRRRFLSAAVVGASTALAGCSIRTPGSSPGTNDVPEAIAAIPDAVGLETVISGLDAPVAVEFAPDGDRRYVAERDGRVLVHEADGRRDEPVLDLRETVLTDGERGLLGIALHPDFAENRRLFVRYSAPRREGTPEDYDHTDVLAAFEVPADGGRVDPDSERTVLEIPQPGNYHNGGDVAFGPDGFLYTAIGEGGGGPGGGQDVTENLLGSIVRIDIDGSDGSRETDDDGDDASGGDGYAVPEDNPLVGEEGLDEYYAWGFRNPWRISFDDDDLYVADVGESQYEEVNLVEKGGNYGWNVKEGTHCFREEECPDETPSDVRGGEALLDPIVEYPHPDNADGADVSGVSVIGGYVYRGSALPELSGAYVFGDFLAEGRLFAATPPDDGDELWQTTVLEVADGAEKLGRLLAFGRDDDGVVYALATGSEGGGLFRIAPAS